MSAKRPVNGWRNCVAPEIDRQIFQQIYMQGGMEHWTINYDITRTLNIFIWCKNFGDLYQFLIGWYELEV